MPEKFYHLYKVRGTNPYINCSLEYHLYNIGATILNDIDQLGIVPLDGLHGRSFNDFIEHVKNNAYSGALLPLLSGAERHNEIDNEIEPHINKLEKIVTERGLLLELHGKKTYDLIKRNENNPLEHNFIESVLDILLLKNEPWLFDEFSYSVNYFRKKGKVGLHTVNHDGSYFISMISYALSDFFGIEKKDIEKPVKSMFCVKLEYLKAENQPLFWHLKTDYFRRKCEIKEQEKGGIKSLIGKVHDRLHAVYLLNLFLRKEPSKIKFKEKAKYDYIFEQGESIIREF